MYDGINSDNLPEFINSKGTSFLSNVRSNSANSFSGSKSRSISSSKYNTPGPGHYSAKENMNPTGTYFNTKMKNSMAGYFDKSARGELNRSATKDIGPGSY